MNTALIVCIVGGIVFALFRLVDKYNWIAELGKLAYFAGLLAYLLKGNG
jgi:hypothetical protein